MVQFEILINVLRFINTSDVLALKFVSKDLGKPFKITVVKRVTRDMEEGNESKKEYVSRECEKKESVSREHSGCENWRKQGVSTRECEKNGSESRESKNHEDDMFSESVCIEWEKKESTGTRERSRNWMTRSF